MNNLDHRIKEYFKAPEPKRKEEFINSLAPSEISFAGFVLSQAGYIIEKYPSEANYFKISCIEIIDEDKQSPKLIELEHYQL